MYVLITFQFIPQQFHNQQSKFVFLFTIKCNKGNSVVFKYKIIQAVAISLLSLSHPFKSVISVSCTRNAFLGTQQRRHDLTVCLPATPWLRHHSNPCLHCCLHVTLCVFWVCVSFPSAKQTELGSFLTPPGIALTIPNGDMGINLNSSKYTKQMKKKRKNNSPVTNWFLQKTLVGSKFQTQFPQSRALFCSDWFYPLENPLPPLLLCFFPSHQTLVLSSILTFPPSPPFPFFPSLYLSLSLHCLLREAAHVYLPLSSSLIPAAVKDSTK